MRITNLAAVMGLGLLLAAGGASAQVVNGTFDVEDKNEPDTDITLTTLGNANTVDMTAVCTAAGDTVTWTATTNKPDQVKISSKTATVDQKQKGNVVAVNVTGAGTSAFDVDLDCDESSLGGSVTPDKATGKGQLKLKNCTGLSGAEGAYVAVTCSGNKTVKGKFDQQVGVIKNANIKLTGPCTNC